MNIISKIKNKIMRKVPAFLYQLFSLCLFVFIIINKSKNSTKKSLTIKTFTTKTLTTMFLLKHLVSTLGKGILYSASSFQKPAKIIG